MTNNKLNNEVGKKIVEALKQQTEEDFSLNENDTFEIAEEENVNEFDSDFNFNEETVVDETSFITKEEFTEPESIEIPNSNESIVDNAFNTDMFESFSTQPSYEQPAAPNTTFEIPSNIAVLKKLISQLPSGVTRHTGAQIIKQTMEALGISMKSVLNEAQQVQESLKLSAKECQTTIQEYKKQITALEKQSQTYQKQYGALNDLISLFIQTTK